jgi:hypothetical protein
MSKQPYTAPVVQEIGSVAELTLASQNKTIADRTIAAGEPNTSS